MTQRYYSAFGLTIASDFAFDVLQETAPVTDNANTLRVLRMDGLRPETPPAIDPYFDIQPDGQYLNWNAVGAFRIDDPATVRVDPQVGVSDHLVSQAFLGLVMSLVLERRGLLCLHAGAVALQNRAAVFLGDKGAGKSTTCGALLARGHVPITDDLVAVCGTLSNSAVPLTLAPGFSAMKLWPDSVDALALDRHEGDRLIHPSLTKVQKQMPTPVTNEMTPLGCLFVLRRQDGVQRPEAVRQPAHVALQMVLRYTFMARYGEGRLGQEHLVRHLKRCGEVVARAPLFDLMVPPDLSRLRDLAEVIEAAVAETKIQV